MIPCDGELPRVRDAPQVTVMSATATTTTRRSMNQNYVEFRYQSRQQHKRIQFCCYMRKCSRYVVVAIPPHDTSLSWKNELYAVLGSYLVLGKFLQLPCTSLWSLIWCISPYSTVVPVETPFTWICLYLGQIFLQTLLSFTREQTYT